MGLTGMRPSRGTVRKHLVRRPLLGFQAGGSIIQGNMRIGARGEDKGVKVMAGFVGLG